MSRKGYTGGRVEAFPSPGLKYSLGDAVKKFMEDKKKLLDSIDEKDITYQDNDSIFVKKPFQE